MKTIVFGNGLGMALNNTHFSLESAFKSADESSALDDTQKELISLVKRLFAQNGMPQKEEHLGILHQAVNATHLLSSLGQSGSDFLTANGKMLPTAANSYITRVALHFWNKDHSKQKDYELPPNFSNSLIEFVKGSAHVVTLNYDGLLYNSLNELMGGYNGWLIDGMLDRGFESQNLEPINGGRKHGWYLHLHGSPLFYDDPKTKLPKKFSRIDSKFAADTVLRRHIVLSAFDQKLGIISQSNLLSAYWSFFERALAMSDAIILCGYSGSDGHINEAIKKSVNDATKLRNNKKIIVVEWNGGITKMDWKTNLNTSNCHFEHFLMDNILEFDWSNL